MKPEIKNMATKLDGWKTYIVVALGVALLLCQQNGWLGFGAEGGETAEGFWNQLIILLGIAGVRHGIGKKA
jgi:hypothetical protein